jgi:hypothetical protein
LLAAPSIGSIPAMNRVVLVLVVAVLAGCGSKAAPPPEPPKAPAPLPDVPFDQLDHDQRAQFMKEKVVPTMAPIFQAYDAKKYAEFGCKTCHGEGAAKGEFHMPNDKLPKLDFNDMSPWKQEALVWMNTKVKPTMAQLLKQPEMSKEHPDGFGCLECHTKPGAPAGKAGK